MYYPRALFLLIKDIKYLLFSLNLNIRIVLLLLFWSFRFLRDEHVFTKCYILCLKCVWYRAETYAPRHSLTLLANVEGTIHILYVQNIQHNTEQAQSQSWLTVSPCIVFSIQPVGESPACLRRRHRRRSKVRGDKTFKCVVVMYCAPPTILRTITQILRWRTTPA